MAKKYAESIDDTMARRGAKNINRIKENKKQKKIVKKIKLSIEKYID